MGKEKRDLSARGFLLPGVPVLALEGFDHQAGPDCAGRNLDASRSPIDHGGQGLKVWPERPPADPGWLEAEAALANLLAAPGAGLAVVRGGAGEVALVWHRLAFPGS